MQPQQLSLFPPAETQNTLSQEWGTFKDSLRAPIHNWFTYPAGFSYKAVAASLKQHQIKPNHTIYDPFMGSGTTNVTAKQEGINSSGVEAHPFVFRIARAKLSWNINPKEVTDKVFKLINEAKEKRDNLGSFLGQDSLPELVGKCYEEKTLIDLLLLRDLLLEEKIKPEVTDFLFVCLTSLLRQVSTAATGWPYIAPKKIKTTSLNKDVLQEFIWQVQKMLDDVQKMTRSSHPNFANTSHFIYNTDARNTEAIIPGESIDHIFTSPPYLNNFDYSDRTRLELYFWGEAKNWQDISQNIRTKLITSATTQISRNDPKYKLSQQLETIAPEVYEFLDHSVHKLSQIRLTKGGKKSYDCLVSGYFNDMLLVLTDLFRVLKPGQKAILVLGDSAPYGVHIPTDELIGKIGVAVGFSQYAIDVLRGRGEKWKDNPQRHNVLLRESIVTLTKP